MSVTFKLSTTELETNFLIKWIFVVFLFRSERFYLTGEWVMIAYFSKFLGRFPNICTLLPYFAILCAPCFCLCYSTVSPLATGASLVGTVDASLHQDALRSLYQFLCSPSKFQGAFVSKDLHLEFFFQSLSVGSGSAFPRQCLGAYVLIFSELRDGWEEWEPASWFLGKAALRGNLPGRFPWGLKLKGPFNTVSEIIPWWPLTPPVLLPCPPLPPLTISSGNTSHTLWLAYKSWYQGQFLGTWTKTGSVSRKIPSIQFHPYFSVCVINKDLLLSFVSIVTILLLHIKMYYKSLIPYTRGSEILLSVESYYSEFLLIHIIWVWYVSSKALPLFLMPRICWRIKITHF